MKSFIRSLAALLCSATLVAAAAAPSDAPQRPADDSLYQAFGAQAGLVRLVDDFMLRLLADARMSPFFKDVNATEFKAKLVEQLCEVAGGPCRRNGPNMKQAHDGVDITRSNFSALVEVLQDAMQAQDIPFRVQNRLLALLAPMHRDIVNAP